MLTKQEHPGLEKTKFFFEEVIRRPTWWSESKEETKVFPWLWNFFENEFGGIHEQYDRVEVVGGPGSGIQTVAYLLMISKILNIVEEELEPLLSLSCDQIDDTDSVSTETTWQHLLETMRPCHMSKEKFDAFLPFEIVSINLSTNIDYPLSNEIIIQLKHMSDRLISIKCLGSSSSLKVPLRYKKMFKIKNGDKTDYQFIIPSGKSNLQPTDSNIVYPCSFSASNTAITYSYTTSSNSSADPTTITNDPGSFYVLRDGEPHYYIVSSPISYQTFAITKELSMFRYQWPSPKLLSKEAEQDLTDEEMRQLLGVL